MSVRLDPVNQFPQASQQALVSFDPTRGILGVLDGKELVAIGKESFQGRLIAFLKRLNLDILFTKITGIEVRLSAVTAHLNRFSWQPLVPGNTLTYKKLCAIANKNIVAGRTQVGSRESDFLFGVAAHAVQLHATGGQQVILPWNSSMSWTDVTRYIAQQFPKQKVTYTAQQNHIHIPTLTQIENMQFTVTPN